MRIYTRDSTAEREEAEEIQKTEKITGAHKSENLTDGYKQIQNITNTFYMKKSICRHTRTGTALTETLSWTWPYTALKLQGSVR